MEIILLQGLVKAKTDGEKVKWLRKYYDLSADDFAKRVGVSQPFISKVENGKKTLGRKTLEKISIEFNIPIQHLITEQKLPEEVAPTPELKKDMEKYIEWIEVAQLAEGEKLTIEEVKQLIKMAKIFKK